MITTMETTSDIIFILDNSGSMESMGNVPITSLRNFVKEQTQICPKSRFTLLTFNHKVETVYDNILLNQYRDFDFKPFGTTALYDAVGFAINSKSQTFNNTNVVCIILTDGCDNASD